jgi:hypothetical protein
VFAHLLFALSFELASDVIATPLTEASKADQPAVITKLTQALTSNGGCVFSSRETVRFIFVLRFDEGGAVSKVEPSYVPERERACLIERVGKISLGRASGARAYAVNASVKPAG